MKDMIPLKPNHNLQQMVTIHLGATKQKTSVLAVQSRVMLKMLLQCYLLIIYC